MFKEWIYPFEIHGNWNLLTKMFWIEYQCQCHQSRNWRKKKTYLFSQKLMNFVLNVVVDAALYNSPNSTCLKDRDYIILTSRSVNLYVFLILKRSCPWINLHLFLKLLNLILTYLKYCFFNINHYHNKNNALLFLNFLLQCKNKQTINSLQFWFWSFVKLSLKSVTSLFLMILN